MSYDEVVKSYELKSSSNDYPETLRKYMYDEFFSALLKFHSLQAPRF